MHSLCTSPLTSFPTYFPPSPRHDIQGPSILKNVANFICSPSDQQLRVLLSIVEAAGSMGRSLHWPWGSLRSLQFGPLLGKLHSMHRIQWRVLLWFVNGSCNCHGQFLQCTTVMMYIVMTNFVPCTPECSNFYIDKVCCRLA